MISEPEVNKAQPAHCAMIEEELRMRAARNSSYSSRAMARDIGITPGYLSQILTNKRRPKFETSLEIAQRLGWGAQKTRDFVSSIQKSQMRRSATLDALGGSNESSYTQMEIDNFNLVSKWYHFAIVELTTLCDFSSQPRWIAERLGIPVSDVRDAIDCLLRVGLLEMKQSILIKTSKKYIYSKTSSSAVRKYHAQMLDLAKQALENQTSEEREFISLTLGVKQERLGDARKLMDKFYLEFMELMEEDPSEAIYQLTLGFFRADVGHRRVDLP